MSIRNTLAGSIVLGRGSDYFLTKIVTRFLTSTSARRPLGRIEKDKIEITAAIAVPTTRPQKGLDIATFVRKIKTAAKTLIAAIVDAMIV